MQKARASRSRAPTLHRFRQVMGVLPANLGRHAAVANLFLKYGGKLSHSNAAESLAAAIAPATEVAEAKQFAADLEKLGPTFVKLGQLLSTRADLLPLGYLNALSRLQDNVEPVPAAVIENTIEDELHVRTSK